jgi:hypothetical protein
MTLCDLVFQDDPFNDDSRHLSVTRVFENDTNSKLPKCNRLCILLIIFLDHAKIAMRLELYHMTRLETDRELKDNLKMLGENAGQQLWEILKPLLLLELADVNKDAVKELQEQCLEITRIASQLNAQLKARYIAPCMFWPIPGQDFDKSQMVFIGEAASSTVQTVRIPLCFGIKTDCTDSAPLIHAKSEVDAIM